MNFLLKCIVIVFLLSLFKLSIAQQVSDTSVVEVFKLGEVTVTESYFNAPAKTIDRRFMQSMGVQTAVDAAKLMPGLRITQSGGRNEALIYIRGLDLRQTPVFVDGVPVYVPYDGYIDLNQFLVGDMAYIRFDKGFASLLYGANTMGGAVNLVSNRPKSAFDLSVGSGMRFSSQGVGAYNGNINMGTKHDKWYASASLSRQEQFHANLPADFDTTDLQQNYKRSNSSGEKWRYALKAAVTPNKTDEYVVSFTGIKSRKDVPVYLGVNPAVKVRYWQYPNWDKNGVYFHSSTMLKSKSIVKTRLFYDTYFNKLKSFDNDQYDSQNFGYSFTSVYDDVSGGGAVEYHHRKMSSHNLKASVQGKYDKHIEYNMGEQQRSMKDVNATIAVEDTWRIGKKIKLLGGIGYFMRNAVQAQSYFPQNDSIGEHPLKNDSELNYQLTCSYNFTDEQSVFLGVARRSRFATMKDRYSYRIGAAIANPALKSEHAFNTELGYSLMSEKVQASVSVFYNFIDNTIQQVSNVVDDLWQMQNTGKSHFRGVEIGGHWDVYQQFSLGVSYDFIDQKNLSNPDLYFIDLAKHRINATVQIEKPDTYLAGLAANYESERYSTSDGQFGAPDFLTFDAFFNYRFPYGILLTVSVQNLTDKLYFITEGYPEMGRRFSIGLNLELR